MPWPDWVVIASVVLLAAVIIKAWRQRGRYLRMAERQKTSVGDGPA